MRVSAIPPKPSTNNNKSISMNVSQNEKAYPEIIRGLFDNQNSTDIQFIPESIGAGKSYSRFVYEVGERAIERKVTNDWTLDLTETTIDTATFVGGIIDGIAKANDMTYLVWAFLDSNFNFAGLGCSRKPYSVFTSVSTAAKTDSSSFTVTNGFQFTIGARVVIRNQETTFGAAPQYEWNWGTITAVANTSITVTMDNEAYGTSISATAANGEIIQWDKFRPYVVTSSSQTLYSNYYCLIGEIETDSSGNIITAYRKDDPWRFTAAVNGLFYNTAGLTTGVTVYLGRYIPIWSTDNRIFGAFKCSLANRLFQVTPRLGWAGMSLTSQVATITVRATENINLGDNASYRIVNNNNDTTVVLIYTAGYYTPGGMRT